MEYWGGGLNSREPGVCCAEVEGEVMGAVIRAGWRV